jgi:hypothetical protein
MAIILFAASWAERDWPLYTVAILGGATGALAGLCIGAITGVVVDRTATSLEAQRIRNGRRQSN